MRSAVTIASGQLLPDCALIDRPLAQVMDQLSDQPGKLHRFPVPRLVGMIPELERPVVEGKQRQLVGEVLLYLQVALAGRCHASTSSRTNRVCERTRASRHLHPNASARRRPERHAYVAHRATRPATPGRFAISSRTTAHP